jgi:hypothetical protein
MSEDDLEKLGFARMVYNIDKHKLKTVYSKDNMICEFSLNSISHKIDGKEVGRSDFFEAAIKKHNNENNSL